jgi:hypothetical protein
MKHGKDGKARGAATDNGHDNYDYITRQLLCYKSIQEGIRLGVLVREGLLNIVPLFRMAIVL